MDEMSEPQGIFELTERFQPIFAAITRAVKAVRPADVSVDEWEDVLQDTLLDAWTAYRAEPEYFTDIKPGDWAKTVAHHHFLNRIRADRRRENREKKYVGEIAPGYYDPWVTNELFHEEDERSRAITREWKLLKSRTRAVFKAVVFLKFTYIETAAALGLTKRIVQRELEKNRPRLARALEKWRPRSTQRPASHPLTPPSLGEGDHHV